MGITIAIIITTIITIVTATITTVAGAMNAIGTITASAEIAITIIVAERWLAARSGPVPAPFGRLEALAEPRLERSAP